MEDAKIIIENINANEFDEKGKIVAIEPESEDYFIGNNVIEAYYKAIQKHPNKKFVFKRIGFKHTFFAGALG